MGWTAGLPEPIALSGGRARLEGLGSPPPAPLPPPPCRGKEGCQLQGPLHSAPHPRKSQGGVREPRKHPSSAWAP